MISSLCLIWDGPLTGWYHFPTSILLMVLIAVFVVKLATLKNQLGREDRGEMAKATMRYNLLLLAISICAGACLGYVAIREIQQAMASPAFRPALRWYDVDVLFEMAGAVVFPLVVIGLATLPFLSRNCGQKKNNARA